MAKTFTDTSRRNDRIAEVLIRIGGVLVIVSVIWILVMISRVALPLFYPPSAKTAATVKLPSAALTGKIVAVGTEETQQGGFLLDDSGSFHFLKLSGGTLSASIKTPAVPAGAARVVSAESIGKSAYTLLWDNGAISSVLVTLTSAKNADGTSTLSHDVTAQTELDFPAAGDVLQSFVRPVEGKGAVRIDRLSGDRLRLTQHLVETDLLGNVKQSSASSDISDPLPGHLTAIAVDSKAH